MLITFRIIATISVQFLILNGLVSHFFLFLLLLVLVLSFLSHYNVFVPALVGLLLKLRFGFDGRRFFWRDLQGYLRALSVGIFGFY